MNERENLINRGFVHFKNLFSVAEIENLRELSEAILEKTQSSHRERFKSNGSLCNLAEWPEYSMLISDQRILNAIKSIGGNDIRWTSGYLISKPPGGDPLFWHQDWWGWDSDISYQTEPTQLFVMIYLTNTNVENGCLRVIPSSHTQWHELHDIPAAHSKELAMEVDENNPIYASHPDELALPVSTGDVLIGDSRLLHSAYANNHDQERPLLTLWYIPNWNTLEASVRATLQTIYERKVIDIDDGSQDYMTCNDWPEDEMKRISALLPDYDGSESPLPWNRIPDKAKFL